MCDQYYKYLREGGVYEKKTSTTVILTASVWPGRVTTRTPYSFDRKTTMGGESY